MYLACGHKMLVLTFAQNMTRTFSEDSEDDVGKRVTHIRAASFRKPAFCICKNKDAHQLRSNCILNDTTISGIDKNWLNNKGLHICHLNIHYLYPKLDEIKILLHNQPNLDIFCICETFLHSEFSDEEIKINGFKTVRKDRPSNGDGLIIYLKSHLTYIRRDDLETIWLEAKINKQKSFLICYCYRPPSSTVDCISTMENSIERAFLDNKEVIVLGDFNFNLLQENTNSKPWIRTFDFLHLNQIIDQPTRVTDTSETLIDHVYTNVPCNITEHTVPHYLISYHFPICVTRKLNNTCESVPVHNSISYRDTRHLDEQQFLFDMENLPWFMFCEAEDPNVALDLFETFFSI